jgi:exopolysaccharide biosynthesis polyprenyl glycosylphosphotransferase
VADPGARTATTAQSAAAGAAAAGRRASRDETPPTPDPVLRRLNRHGFRLVHVADGAVLGAVAVITMIVRFGRSWPTYPVGLYLGSFAVTVAIFVTALYFGGLYEREPRLGAPPVLPRVTRLLGVAGGATALLNLAATALARELGISTARALPMPITNLVVLIIAGSLAVAANRRLVHLLRQRREGPPRVVLLGTADEVALARRHLDGEATGALVVGEAAGPDDLMRLVADREATDVLVLSRATLDRVYPEPVTTLTGRGLTVLHRVGPLETMFGLERIREVGGLPFVLLRNQWLPTSRRRFKRLFDLLLLVVALPVWLPVLALVALHQLVVAGRPLLFVQTRVGVEGREFGMVKFRTMRVGAEEDGRARLAEVDDPRILPACRWVRATRLDELPQLWNVLRGQMSLVGPRPERPELTAGFAAAIPGYHQRHEVPPGVTGLAQISGRYHTDAEYKLGYDLQYLANWSPILDLEILLRTVTVVLGRRP